MSSEPCPNAVMASSASRRFVSAVAWASRSDWYARHTSAGYTMLTGVPHPQANGRSAKDVNPTPNDHPHPGALLASQRTPRDGMPVFASLPEVIRDAGIKPEQ